MTFAQWAKNNTKINDGKDFDEAYLLGIFERIVKTPLRLNEIPVSEDGPRKVCGIFFFEKKRFLLFCCRARHSPPVIDKQL
jgi:hypothetical protein